MVFLVVFTLALFFILFFKMQKAFFPSLYFAFSDPFIRHESLGLKRYLSRIFVVVFFNAFFYLILNFFYDAYDIFILLLAGSFLGAFLILWPIIFRPSLNLEDGLTKKSKFYLYSIYILFLILTIITSILTSSIMSYFFEESNIENIFSSNKESILLEILSFPILAIIDNFLTKKYRNNRDDDDKKMTNSTNEDNSGEDDVDDKDYRNNQEYNVYRYVVLSATFITLIIGTINSLKKKDRKE